MLKLYNKEHVAVSALTNLKDYKIEYLLSGEDLFEFSLSISDENIHLVEEEGYVRNKFNEYVIKAIDPSDNFKRFSCIVNIEDIKAKSIKSFDTSNNNITDTIRLAIAGTGWILADNNIIKRRTVRVQNTNALEVLREVRKVFNVDFRFDAINKVISVYEQFGSDKGVYFSDELNLRSLSIPSDTYDYATRLYCYGKDGLNISSINDGKEYVENYQYSSKVIEVIWEDNRYTDVNSLKEDAEAKLEELSKPKRSYQASVSDLAKQSEEYSFLDFFLGDTVTLLSKQEKFRDKQRIVKYIEYPNNPSQNTCELGNTTLTFEELQKENEVKNQVVDNITSDNGTVDGSKVDSITTEQISDFEASVAKITDLTVVNAEITNLKAQNVTITGKLNAIEGEFGTLKANVATIDKLTVTHTAQINNLEANKASITQLESVSATIGIVEAEVAKIQTLVNGNLTSENIHSLHLTSASVTVDNGFIKNAMIDNLDVSKINAGDISTNKFRIISDDGGIEIVGATQQFKDKNNKVRVQIGKDKNNNFTFSLFDESGIGVLIDHTGIKEGAIANDLIISDMLASDSVGEKQINYSSFVTGFNKDTNTSAIKSTKIMLNNQNQTLDVAFNSLKTQVDTTKSLTELHSTSIGVMQGQITTAINNTKIVKDGETILLKDDYNRTVSTVNSMQSTIGQHTTQISGLNSTVSTQGSSIEQLKNQISLKVEQTDIDTSINNIQSSTNNLLKNSTFKTDITGWIAWSRSNTSLIMYDTGDKKALRVLRTDTTTGSQTIGLMYNLKELYFNLGGWYTLSFRWRSYNNVSVSNMTYLYIIHDSGNIALSTLPEYSFNYRKVENGYYQIIVKFKPSSSISNARLLIGARLSTGTEANVTGFGISEIMLTSGNQAMDWIASPYDVSKEIDTKITTAKAEIQITTDSIISTVNKYQTDLNWLADESSRIEQKANSIQNTVTSIQGDYVGQSQFTQTVDNFEFKFTNKEENNLLTNSAFKNGLDGWYLTSDNNGYIASHYMGNSNLKSGGMWPIWSEENGVIILQKDFVIACDEGDYAFSGYIETYNCNTQISFAAWDNDTGWNTVGWWGGLTNHWGYFKNVINFTDKSKICRVKIEATRVFPNLEIQFNVSEFKLSKGTVFTSWIPNNSEIYDGITMIDRTGVTVAHNDGSYSKMSGNGFEFFTSGSSNRYHNLMVMGEYECYSEETRTITLPNEFKGKPFKVITSVKRMKANYDLYSYKFPLLSFYAQALNIDTTNGTFQVYASVRAWNQPNVHSSTWGQLVGDSEAERDQIKPVVAYWVIA